MSDVTATVFDVLRQTAAGDHEMDERLRSLIGNHGWEQICAAIFGALEGRDTTLWYPAAAAIWGAVLDEREMDMNRAIALVYHRLDASPSDDVRNLAWSIASRLKGVNYLSTYNPLSDPDVKAHLDRLKAS